MELGSKVKVQRPIPPSGQHVGRCFMLIDMGTHMKSYQNQPAVPTRSCQIGWELTRIQPYPVFDDRIGAQPYAIFNEYTVPVSRDGQRMLTDRSNLKKMLCSWKGVGLNQLQNIDLKNILGKTCMISVVHQAGKDVVLPFDKSINKDGRMIYAKVGSVTPPIHELPCPPAVNPVVYFDLDSFSWESFMKVPEWIKGKLRESREWSGIVTRFGSEPQRDQPQQWGGQIGAAPAQSDSWGNQGSQGAPMPSIQDAPPVHSDDIPF